MDAKEYKQKSLRTESNDFEAIRSRMDDDMIRLLHTAMGLQTEVAEFTDMLKKHLFYGKPIDKVNLKEELFDATWYMSIGLDVLKYEFEQGFEANIAKLKARYPAKFDEFQAENRDLNKEREILEGKDNL